ncbi:hypothetical protein GRS80_06870 [Natrialba sp. INN-245]|nr:hypothetical protein [Natrialba sp. INN-245]
MNSEASVGSTPHTRQEASPAKRSDARCACGATPDGYDARRNEPACRSCATTRADNPPQHTIPGTRETHDHPLDHESQCGDRHPRRHERSSRHADHHHDRD